MIAENDPDGTGCSEETTTARALLCASAAAAWPLMATARSDGRSARAGCTRRSILILPSPSRRPASACAISLVNMNFLEILDRYSRILARPGDADRLKLR